MDECSGRRNRGGIAFPKKASSLVSRDVTDNREQNAQFCNRIGCRGRIKYSRSSPLDCAKKPKGSRPSFRSLNGKEIVGSSSRTCFPITSVRNSQDSPKELSSHLETHLSKSSGVQGLSHVTKLIPATGRNQTRLQPEKRVSSAGKVTPKEVESPSLGSKNICKRILRHEPQPSCQNAPSGPSISSTENSMKPATRNNDSGSRYSLRNLKCNSISDVIPQGGSCSESMIRRDMLKKKSTEGESSSSSKGKRGSVAPSEDDHGSASISGISVSGSRRSGNWASNNDSSSPSVRTKRPVNANTRITRSSRENINASSVTTSKSINTQSPRSEIQDNANHSSPYESFMEASSNASSSYSLSERIIDSVPGIVSFTSTEHGSTLGLRRHNLNGAAEVLLALERIEQDIELSYEQLLILENNLFSGDLSFFDQHREMRLDIDNMSYEELLALGDRMGTVSTALSDEAFAKCVKRTIYQNAALEVGGSGCGEDEADIKCSVCQEEYTIGDEIGKLECEHGYHLACLQQWLRLKNWCPVCKASAAPSESSLSS